MTGWYIVKYSSHGHLSDLMAVAIVGQVESDSPWMAFVYGLDPLDQYSGKLMELWAGMYDSFGDAVETLDSIADRNG